jgi:hypothetical protein
LLGSLWFNSFSAGAPASSDYELISTTVLGSSVASVTFSGLGTSAAAYKHLQLRAVYGSNAGGNGTYIRAQLNGDTGSNYSYHVVYGQGSSVLSTGGASQTAMPFSPLSGTGSSTQADAIVADILDFSNTSKNKTTRILAGGPGYGSINLISGAWYSTSAVTSLSLLAFSQGSASTFGSGSRFSLYGLKG